MSCISFRVFPFVSGRQKNVKRNASIQEPPKSQKVTSPPKTSTIVVKLVVKPNPTSQVSVMANADPFERTFALNISPTIAFGIVPKPTKYVEIY